MALPTNVSKLAVDRNPVAETYSHHPARTSVEPASNVERLYTEAAFLNRANAGARSQVIDWCQRAHDCLVAIEDDPRALAPWRDQILPLFMKSDFLRRCRTQPRGYAGDFQTIQMMYDCVPSGADSFGVAVDAWAMNQPCVRAVRNRRHLVRSLLEKVAPEFRNEAHVVSLGCGPAAEVFDLASMNDFSFTLIDIDDDAIAYLQKRIVSNGMADRVTAVRANIVRMMFRDNVQYPTPPAVFYSLGVIDYFDDEMVVRMLDYIHAKLAPGGLAFLGNFKPAHPNAAFFQHALNWPLKLRSTEDLRRLVERSKFVQCQVKIGAEREGIQLFVECRKTH